MQEPFVEGAADGARPPALRVEGLEHRFRGASQDGAVVLQLPDLVVPRGATMGVRGESGSGKTTLLHLVAGILPVESGTIEVMGEPMHGHSEGARDRLRARHVGYVFQTFNLIPHLTALENVALGMAFRGGSGSDHRADARRALERVGLADRAGHRPAQLSVGQQQRVAIARALAGRPGLVLADEPTANLDRVRAEACLALLLDFARECEAGVLLVSHDDAALARCSTVVTLPMPAAVAP